MTQMNIVGFDKSTIERILVMSEQPQTIGWASDQSRDFTTDEVEAYLLENSKHPKVVALGEIGLITTTAPKEVIEQVFVVRFSCST